MKANTEKTLITAERILKVFLLFFSVVVFFVGGNGLRFFFSVLVWFLYARKISEIFKPALRRNFFLSHLVLKHCKEELHRTANQNCIFLIYSYTTWWSNLTLSYARRDTAQEVNFTFILCRWQQGSQAPWMPVSLRVCQEARLRISICKRCFGDCWHLVPT